MNEMSLFGFLAEQREQLLDFEVYWKEQRKVNKEHYPMKLSGGDWWEQFVIFMESNVGGNKS